MELDTREMKSQANGMAKNFKNQADGLKGQAESAAEKVTDMVQSKINDYDIQGSLKTLRSQAMTGYDLATEVVRKYPLASLAGALVIGFAAAAALRRPKTY